MFSGRNNQIYIITDYILKGLSRKDNPKEFGNLHSMICDTHEYERKEWKIIVTIKTLVKDALCDLHATLYDLPTRE